MPPQYSSRRCSRCGSVTKDLRGDTTFECGNCGLVIDRQLNAAVNLYRKMVGVPHSDAAWWNYVVLPSLVVVGGYVESGAERKGTDEPVRFLYEAVKPKIHYAYDRCADAYLPTYAYVDRNPTRRTTSF